METRFKTAYLFDIYAPLLTDKQRLVMELYINEDLTMSEIAEQLQFTRQASFDLIRRTENILNDYDAKLMLFEKYMRNKELLERIRTRLSDGKYDDALVESLIDELSDSL